MECIAVFLGLMVLIAAFSHGGRQSASDSVVEGLTDSAEVVKDGFGIVVVGILIVSALMFFGVLK